MMKTSLISEQHAWPYSEHTNVFENVTHSSSQKFKCHSSAKQAQMVEEHHKQ